MNTNDPHAMNKKLYAIDVALIGADKAFKRWQTKWPDRVYWAPCVMAPRFHNQVDEKRDPSAPPLPSWDWHEAPIGSAYLIRYKNGSWKFRRIADPALQTAAHLQTRVESRPPQAWFEITANMTRAEYEALQRLAKGEAAGPELARNQPCGCVVCRCEDEEQCQGCGARSCGKHPGEPIPDPAYCSDEPTADGVLSRNNYAHYDFSFGGVRIDPYRILLVYGITHPAHQHALKKLLRAGKSGKELRRDLAESRDSITRYLEMLDEDVRGGQS